MLSLSCPPTGDTGTCLRFNFRTFFISALFPIFLPFPTLDELDTVCNNSCYSKMRTIVNISLTPELARRVEEALAKGNYASKSEFFRDLLRLWEEEQLLEGVRESQGEIARGKGKILKSLRGLR